MSQYQTHRQSQSLRQTQGLRLSLEQRLELRQELRQEQIMFAAAAIARYSNVVHQLVGLHVNPAAICPNCDYRLQSPEILVGYLPDPHDVTTKCPRCKRRFEASAIVGHDASTAYAFLCGPQVVEALREMGEIVKPDNLREKKPHLYYASVFHFGSVEGAYRQFGVSYPYRDERDLSWQTKARPLLGNVMDGDIAAILNVKRTQVKNLREGFNVQMARGVRSIMPSRRTIRLN